MIDTLFLERVLQLLAQGSFTTTYKYALLLSLIDLCVEGVGSGAAPTSVTTTQVADHLIALYWSQTRPYADYADSEPHMLLQSTTRHRGVGHSQAGILRVVAELRAEVGDRARVPSQARKLNPTAYESARDEVEWIAVSKPIPRLQVLGETADPFLYHIHWVHEQNSGRRDPSLPRPVRKSDLRRIDFDNRLVFLPGVSDQLVALAAILRPLVHRQWANWVSRTNGLQEHKVEGWLFGQDRAALGRVRSPLWNLQAGRCFYCDRPLSEASGEVDHVLPWSRYADDDLDNLVVADSTCNGRKSDFLVGYEFIRPWTDRSATDLEGIASQTGWPRDPQQRVRRTAAVVYSHLSPGVPLWRGQRDFRKLEEAEQRDILKLLRTGGVSGGGPAPE